MSAYIKTKSGEIVPQNADLATRHLGIIAQRSIYWYRMLPMYARNSYDLDDMIGDVVLHVVKRAHIHNIARGKESTFVWHTADNKCMSILSHYKTKQYSACSTVEMTPDVIRKVPNDSELNQFYISLNAVERVIERGSDRLLDLIEQIFTGTVSFQTQSQSCFNETLQELKALADAQSATFEDFMRVYQYFSC